MAANNYALPFRQCKDCSVFFPGTKDYFPKIETVDGKDFLRGKCHKCHKIGRLIKNITRESKEKRYKKSKEWRDNNPEKCKKYATITQLRYPERVREQKRVGAAKFRKNNPEKMKASIRKSYARHPETLKINRLKRKTRKKLAPFLWTEQHENFARGYWEGLCAYCGKEPGFWHIIVMDHFVPLSNKDTLGTVPENMIPACNAKSGSPPGVAACNQSKRGKDAAAWLPSRFGPPKARAKLKAIAAFFVAAKVFAAGLTKDG